MYRPNVPTREICGLRAYETRCGHPSAIADRPRYDNFLRQIDMTDDLHDIRGPTLPLGGWQDLFTTGSPGLRGEVEPDMAVDWRRAAPVGS